MNARHSASPHEVRTATADVVIVGSRVAGAATAAHLARAGHDVLMLDRARFPSDTISTHVIARSGMVLLSRLGVVEQLVEQGAPPIRRVEFSSGLGRLDRVIKDRYGTDFVLAPRRYALDEAIQRTALAAGARLWEGFAMDGVRTDATGRATGVLGHDEQGPVVVRAAHVVGADGLSSRVARSVGARPTMVRPSSGACQYAYFAGQWDAIEYHLADGVFAGVFPTHGGEACVWAITSEEMARRHRHRRSAEEAFAGLLSEQVPALAERVGPEAQRAPVRGMLRMPNHFREAHGPGWSLVGDAGYHRDAITGHGISDALCQAELAAAAIDASLRCPSVEEQALADYERTRDRLSRPIFETTVALAAFPDQPTFVGLQRRLALEIDELAEELHQRPLPRAAPTHPSPERKAETHVH
ncbi:FAD-dependent monooxygenase [Intrasporangium calvum]|uniref:FAD-dependent monooxygenase n=1 Tax=Intrasporangium calvum TaxID=53358 RepID=A0ABT5GKY5_9MICO|nr:FAD-dependent monooxygenase [Intrasporangium calvum]MDC5698884.1 FAD-dependent monooxygenase [Intrasporangium calvum]